MSDVFDPTLQAFVRAHEHEDPARLLLGTAPAGIDLRAAAEQITSRRKARGKLPTWLAEPDVVMPPPLAVEQASSETTAAYKASLLGGEALVDLSGGMGVDTLALAAGFRRASYVEADAHLCRVFTHNARALSASTPEVVHGTAERFAAGGGCDGASVYVDPARRVGQHRRVSGFREASPDVTALLPQFGCVARVLIKASPMIDLQAGMRDLPGVSAVHVVSVGDECREVLFLVEPGFTGEPVVHCAALNRHGAASTFSFRFTEEQTTDCDFADPGTYLYDPNTAIRKAGAFRTVAARFGLAKLAPSTHLYTAEALRPDFPGRVFQVEGAGGKRPRQALPEGRGNVMSRNHPLGADALRRRYRIGDGGDHWLIGLRDRRGRAQTLIARRVDGSV